MSKKIFTAALLATLAVGAQAQAPVLYKVKTISDPLISGVLPLNGQAMTGISVVGNTMFYCGSGATRATLVKVVDWNTATPTFTKLFEDLTVTSGRPAKVAATSNLVFFGTSVGQNAANSGDTSQFQSEIFRLLYDGSNPSEGIINFVDGKLTAAELGFTSGVGMQDFKIDPGFGATPTARLAVVRGDSRGFRMMDLTSGAQAFFLGSATSFTLYRAIDFDSLGNAYIKWQKNTGNEVYKLTRTAATGDVFTGFDAGTLLTTVPYPGSIQGQGIGYVPAASGAGEFLMHNDPSLNSTYIDAATTPGALVRTLSTAGTTTGYPNVGGAATTFGAITNDLVLPFQSREVALGTVTLNGTQYVFMANYQGTRNAVEVLQVGNNGRISGNIAFNDLSSSAPTIRTATVRVLDASTNALLDSKVVTTSATGDYTFISTARGNVRILIDAAHYLKKEVTASVALNAPITGINAALINGDVNDDNFIGFDDFDILSASFNLSDTDPGFVAGADLNEDLFVGFDDFDILSANFNTAGDDE